MISQNTIEAVPQKRVIVVEDEEAFRKVIVHYLTLSGYEVTGVGSAFEFYQHIEKPFDVAILDVGLPDQGGLVLAAYLRKNSDMRIILLTGLSSISDRVAGYNAGADLYLVKPVVFCEIAAAIKSLLSRDKEMMQQSFGSSGQKPIVAGSDSLFWTLVCTHWQLVTPEQACVKLTSKEFDFLMLLVAKHKQVVPRSALLKNLGYVNNQSSHSSLESLVRRLRRKIDAVSSSSPIQTSHGNGYGFSEPLVVV